MSAAEELRELAFHIREDGDGRSVSDPDDANLLDQAAAELDRLGTQQACAVCGGSGVLVSGLPCICGGDGSVQAEAQGLRELVSALAAELDRLRAVIQRGIDWLPADERGKVYDWKVEAKQALEHPR